MSDIDIKALEANFEVWRKERVPSLEISRAFERYTCEQILKDFELSDEEIGSGIIGGEDDGGIDGMYFFVNSTLIQDETDMPEPAQTAELYLIQSKMEKGFGENVVEKMFAFTRDLLDYSKSVDQFTYLNSYAKDAIIRFREKYNAILGSQHTLNIRFFYANKSDSAPNTKVTARVQNLKHLVVSKLSMANVEFNYWGCTKLLAAARTSPQVILKISYTKYFNTGDKSVVCLVRLKDFADFLRDDKGDLRRSLLEPNVRDYQGKRNLVNIDIQKTLDAANDSTEFWWLNNGVTILATDCHISGDKIVIEHPEIVNGLQTTQEIFTYFERHPSREDSRNILLRIIIPPEEPTRNRIIKATNFQTPVSTLSLHATEPLHFDIEERLKLFDIFYDRRKGYYRQLRKPVTQTVSGSDIARTVIAIILQQPDYARARPQTLTNKEETYTKIFSDNYNRDVFVACILLDRQVKEYVDKQGFLNKDEQRNIRFYTAMSVACEMTQTAKPTPDQIAALVPRCVEPIPETILSKACQDVSSIYRMLVARMEEEGVLNPDDKVAKGVELKDELIQMMKSRFPSNPGS